MHEYVLFFYLDSCYDLFLIPTHHRNHSKFLTLLVLACRSHPINLLRGKCFQVLSFKGSAQNDESNHSDSSLKFTKTPVKFSHTQEESEVITEPPDVQNHPISYASEGNDATRGSLAIQKLFRKWLLMLRTQTSSPADEILCEKMVESETSEGQKVTSKGEAAQLLKSMVAHFPKLDAAISLPLLIW